MNSVASFLTAFAACLTVLDIAVHAGEKAYNIHISSLTAQECPDVEYLVKTKKVEIVPEFSQAIRTDDVATSKNPSSLRILMGGADPMDTQTSISFPSCFNLRVAVRVLKQLEEPELDILAESLGLGASLSCETGGMNQLGSGCMLTSKRSDDRSCRICDICQNLQRLDDDLRKNSVVELKNNCQSRCCKEPSEKPYVFTINNLCISDKDVLAAADKAGAANYKGLVEGMQGGKIKDTLRFRAEIRDRYFPSNSFVGNLLLKSNSGSPAPSSTIGCFEVMANYEITSETSSSEDNTH